MHRKSKDAPKSWISCISLLNNENNLLISLPPALVMVTGTPWTWTPLMLIVCTACAAEDSCDGLNAIIPPAGAILARVRSFLAPACVLLPLAGSEAGDVGATEVVGLVVFEPGSCS